MMDNTAFRRKVETRKYAIEHSWRESEERYIEQIPASSDNVDDGNIGRMHDQLERSLWEADMSKFNDGYFPLQSAKLGRAGIFIKRVVRKILMLILGWYLRPIYQRQNYFNAQILNAVSLERAVFAEELAQYKTYMAELKRQSASTAEGLERYKSSLGADLKYAEENVKQLSEQLHRLENLPTDDDDFYHSFEEVFRGSREEIRKRMEVYVPIIMGHLSDWSTSSFVDVGSGRGEWLDILKYHGAQNYVGVDLNERQNKIAESFGHKTVCDDCIVYLKNLPTESLDLITGFQIIEHLYMSDLMKLFQQCYRTLKKGGMVLFETPNPNNLIVAANTFYTDVSHKRPLNQETMRFWLQWCGFSEVKVLDENTHSHWQEVQFDINNEEQNRLSYEINEINWKLYGPQDYALFAIK